MTTTGSMGTSVGPFAVNGQRTQANNFLLDGADSNDSAINVPDAVDVMSPNALGEFRVITGAMKAEYGRDSGAIIESTIKSGTNQFHGQGTEVFRNSVLNANNFISNESRTCQTAIQPQRFRCQSWAAPSGRTKRSFSFRISASGESTAKPTPAKSSATKSERLFSREACLPHKPSSTSRPSPTSAPTNMPARPKITCSAIRAF